VRFALLLTLAFALPSSVQAATPLFDMFKTLCIDTGADPEAVKKAASAMGGKAGPDFETDDRSDSSKENGQNWAIGKDAYITLGTEFSPATRSAPAENDTSCTVATYHLPDEAGIARLRQWAGVARLYQANRVPSLVIKDVAFYSFQVLNGKHVPMPEGHAEFDKARASGHFWTLSVMDVKDGAMVELTHHLPP
jgi:hypothetical protein